jgi:hypothetical protein
MGLIHIELFATLDLVGQSPGGPNEDRGRSATELRERLCAATTSTERFAVLESALRSRLPDDVPGHRAVPFALAWTGTSCSAQKYAMNRASGGPGLRITNRTTPGCQLELHLREQTQKAPTRRGFRTLCVCSRKLAEGVVQSLFEHFVEVTVGVAQIPPRPVRWAQFGG